MKKPAKEPKQMGRPRTASIRMPIFEHQKQCSEITGIPLAVIKAAKAGGCDAFIDHRIDSGKLIPWLFKRDTGADEAGAAGWREELAKWQAKRAKIAHDKDAGLVLDRDVVATHAAECMGVLFSELDRIFAAEFPASAKGLDEIGIREKAIASLETLKEALAARFKTIGQTDVKEEEKE